MANSLGKFADQVAQGNVFSVSTVVAGLAIPISTSTAPAVALWNRLDSGVRLVPLRYVISYVSGTSVASGIGFQFATGAGRKVGATEIYTAFANSSPLPAILGAGTVSKAYASSAGTNTLANAIVAWTSPCFGMSALVATTAMNPYTTVFDFEGLLQMNPGTTIWPAGSAASGALYHQTLYWAEVPLP